MLGMCPFINNTLSDILMPLWMEICIIIFLPLGWQLVSMLSSRGAVKPYSKARKPSPPLPSNAAQARASAAFEAIKNHVAAGNLCAAVLTWRQDQRSMPAAVETLRLVVRSLAATSPETLVEEITRHLEQHAAEICDSRSAAAILEELSICKNAQCMDGMSHELHGHLGIPLTTHACEALIAGHAAAGNEARVNSLLCQAAELHHRLTARCHALVVKGFLHNKMLDAAMAQAKAMLKQGYYVPSFAIMHLVKLGSEEERLEDLFGEVLKQVELPVEAVAFLFEDCAKRCDSSLALEVEKVARRDNSGVLPLSAYTALLKVLVAAADPRAQEILQEMQKVGVPVTSSFFAHILARCAESKFLSFAQHLADVLRAQDCMTAAVYSALVKVYTACGLSSQASELYSEMREHGLKPTGAMLKFAAKVGRDDVPQCLAESLPRGDMKQQMALIQAAGRKKDLEGTFALLRNLENYGRQLDAAVYNCVLDACINAGNLGLAHSLMREMRTKSMVNIISWNTCLKGCISAGNVRGAQELFEQIGDQGLMPNSVTYNIMINTAANAGDFVVVWDFVDKMKRSGTSIDQYTISIIMRALKTQRGKPRDVQRAMSLLDHISFDLCSGPGLSIAIETAIKYQQIERVQHLVEVWEKSYVKPCAHTSAALVKAYSALNKLGICKELWEQAIQERDLESNQVLLCIVLDAFITKGEVDDAMSIFNDVNDRLPPNMVVYCTVAKGLALQGRLDEGMQLWRKVRATGAKLSTSFYNALIDIQARHGVMHQVDELIRAMEQDGCEKDHITYSTMLKSHCVNGDFESACALVHDMVRMGFVPDSIVYNKILDACAQHDRVDLADRILQNMRAANIAPTTFTLCILVKLFGRCHRLDRVFALVDEMTSKDGIVLNMQVCTSWMSACIHNRDIDRAVDVFKQLKHVGIDARAYAVLISGLLKAGRLKEAVAAVEEAYGLSAEKRALPASEHLPSECLERLFFAIRKHNFQETLGTPLLERLRAIGVALPLNTISSTSEQGRRPVGRTGRRCAPNHVACGKVVAAPPCLR